MHTPPVPLSIKILVSLIFLIGLSTLVLIILDAGTEEHHLRFIWEKIRTVSALAPAGTWTSWG